MKLLRRGLIILTVVALVVPAPMAGAQELDIQPSEEAVVSVEPKGLEIESDDVSKPDKLVTDTIDNDDVEITTDSIVESADEIDDLPTTDNPTMQQDPVPVIAPKIVISKIKIGPKDEEFVELYNPNDFPVSLEGWQLQYLKSDFTNNDPSSTPTRKLKTFSQEVMDAGSFYTVGHSNFVLQPTLNSQFDVSYSGGSLAQNGSVRLVATDQVVDLIGWGSAKQFEGESAKDESPLTLQRCQDSHGAVVDSNSNSLDFRAYVDEDGREVMQLGQFVQCPPRPPIDEPEIPELPILNRCEGLKLNEIGANLSGNEQFVEIKNTSDKTIDLKGCLLATNRSKTKFYDFGDVELESGDVLAVKIIDTDLTLTKTTVGTVFLLDEAKAEIDTVHYEYLSSQTSWSLIDGEWVVTYKITPNEANQFQRWAECQAGYWRNELTGRCNKIVEPAVLMDCGEGRERNPLTGRCRNIPALATLAPCKEGQYRSEETGRCRSIALAAKVLKPCADDEFRNPATNRCKKIAADSDVLKECAEGFERNPATNRCRKVLSATAPTVPFAPEKVQQVAGGTLGWWAFGGLSLVAVSYGAWQWRFEMGRLIRRAAGVFSSGGK